MSSKIDNKSIIARINKAKDSHGVSVYQLAKESGLDGSNLKKQMNGQVGFSHGALSKIARALNVSLVWLEKGIGDMMCPETQEFIREENEKERKKDDKEDDESAIRELVSEIKKQNEVMKQQNEVLVQQLNASQEQIKMLLDIIAKK